MPARKATTPSRRTVGGYVLNCQPSPQIERNWTLATAAAAGVYTATPSRGAEAKAAAGANIDLRQTWWKVGDQGATGSCVGWGTADAVLRWHFVNAGRLARNEPLSVRFIWMASKETDAYTTRPTSFIESDGTWLSAALDISRKFGVVTDKVLPFALKTGKQMYGGDMDTFYALAAQRKIASYFNLGRNLDAWRRWLQQHGPILTRLDCDDAWMNCTGKLDAYDAQKTHGGHCVAIVGYVNGRFIVRNSWGTGWGDRGFAMAADTYAQPAFTEAFGVTL